MLLFNCKFIYVHSWFPLIWYFCHIADRLSHCPTSLLYCLVFSLVLSCLICLFFLSTSHYNIKLTELSTFFFFDTISNPPSLVFLGTCFVTILDLDIQTFHEHHSVPLFWSLSSCLTVLLCPWVPQLCALLSSPMCPLPLPVQQRSHLRHTAGTYLAVCTSVPPAITLSFSLSLYSLSASHSISMLACVCFIHSSSFRIHTLLAV